MSKPVILTGIRANDVLTLGNYLGGILPMVELQKQYAGSHRLNVFIPDLHSFTTPVDHSLLYDNMLQNLYTYVAAGLQLDDPDTFIYRQSFVPAHSELAVILNNFTYYGELQRMTQFKEKSQQAKAANVTAGLFNYPVLMAADILLYGAEWVPVGEDQRQHLELARDLAMRLNSKFGAELLTPPVEWSRQLEFAGRDQAVRIRSLRHPEQKMSKSVEDPNGTILLTDNPAEAAKKIMSAETDSLGVIHFDLKSRPGVSNLLQILALLTGRPLPETIHAWEGQTSYGELKKQLAQTVEEFLSVLQSRLEKVDRAEVTRQLEMGELMMREVTTQRLYKIQQAVGLRR